ncbi:MAG: D-alanine--D-alanine ligase [Alphaproteobacteria bacterium]|nr:D-alanine--D-alanine ligase [Alphaproteobacteria bacterium]
MKKVVVVKGGFSSERDVSLVSGAKIAEALRSKGYEVIEHDLTDGWVFCNVLQKEKPDVVFNALHGNWGEDGEIQGFLDVLQIPYTHSSMKASLLGMNKELTKEIAFKNGIKTAPYEKMTFKQFQKYGTKIEMPYVVKPSSDGSSVGVFIVQNKNDASKVFYEDENAGLIVEKYIAGRELTVSVLNDKSCAVTELKPETEFYDYKAKYTNGMTRHILPADVSDDVCKTAMDYALKIHRLLKCQTVSRSDFRFNEQDGVVFLEINTNPGMTPLSLVPEQAKYIGVSYEDLCATLVENATCRKIK